MEAKEKIDKEKPNKGSEQLIWMRNPNIRDRSTMALERWSKQLRNRLGRSELANYVVVEVVGRASKG